MRRGAINLAWVGGLLTSLVGLSLNPLASRERVPNPLPEFPSGVEEGPEAGHRPTRPDIDVVWQAAPFRPDRVPPAQHYTVELGRRHEAAVELAATEASRAEAEAEAAAHLAAERPPWSLTGIVRGEPALALFRGVPGADIGAVVAEGEERDGFVIAAIHADSVVVTRDGQAWTFAVEAYR